MESAVKEYQGWTGRLVDAYSNHEITVDNLLLAECDKF